MFGALEPPSRSAPIAAFPSVFNACVWNIQQVQKSFCACTPAVIIRCWLGRQIKKKNPHSFLPIVQNESCPVLLTTKNSCFENYATGKPNCWFYGARLRSCCRTIVLKAILTGLKLRRGDMFIERQHTGAVFPHQLRAPPAIRGSACASRRPV